MAYGDWFDITLSGPGGHASAPERAGNPIRAGAVIEERLVELAKTLSTPQSRVVATVTEFLSGNTVNVIPTTGGLRGTIRTVTTTQREALHESMQALVSDVASQMGLEAGLTIHDGYPAVQNDPIWVDSALRALADNGLTDVTEMDHPSMVIEDFSYFLHRWPGAMFYLGAAVGDSPAFNHSAFAQFDDGAMSTGLDVFIALANTPPLSHPIGQA